MAKFVIDVSIYIRQKTSADILDAIIHSNLLALSDKDLVKCTCPDLKCTSPDLKFNIRGADACASVKKSCKLVYYACATLLINLFLH